MTTVSFPYGKGQVTYDFAKENFQGTLVSSLHGYKPEREGVDLIKNAMEHPIGSERLSVLAKGKK